MCQGFVVVVVIDRLTGRCARGLVVPHHIDYDDDYDNDNDRDLASVVDAENYVSLV
jgi:hypothetical protein